ncbi:class A beta-lactamase [Oceanobacillus arenosus]|uniref:Beta-lactamase n=1 Tax=Oceanobacillus arenosus TaxID=1229153 RepID=A0A3D8PI95_9BACI|nr:class A beta-lactamase [Oceanobacillus arenosus]RDW15820.1 class A beta-lactamase [Oceanobacillus arenosus]
MKKLTHTILRARKLEITILLCLLAIIALAGCADKGEKEQSASEAPSKAENHKTESSSADNEFAKLEETFDARLGVYAIDTGSGQVISYQEDERFAYTSTFKALASGALLQKNEIEDLNKVITYTEDELITYSPVTEKHVDTGMTLREIIEAAVRYSDNTAGNLLLNELGGPEGFEEALREIGDEVTEADRFEPTLNTAVPGDSQDTSTPKAVATSLKEFAVSDLLSEEKRAIFNDWLSGNATGDKLIRAGVPDDWKVGDKSGAGGYGTRNDIAVIWPPDREPIVIAILSSRDTEDATYDDALIAEAAKVVVNVLMK